jgi:phosphoribosyl 1,2-cyclic phosphate phosphodiesterase
MKLVVLGSGTSHGVPVVGCDCSVCRSMDPHDNRTRSSLYIEGDGGERLIIDTGPEFRIQALRAGITRLDAVFLTHAHADHVHGLDDLRSLSYEKEIPVYGNARTLEELRERFSYVFKETQRGGGKPRINLQTVSEPVRLGSLTLTPLPVKHGALDVLGWKISEADDIPSVVYLTDTSEIPAPTLAAVAAPEVLIIGALRIRPHQTHLNFPQALSAGLGMGARRVYLTHICHDLSHRDIEDYCRNFRKDGGGSVFLGPAYDGLEIFVSSCGVTVSGS